jgi:hypothetical protein
VLGHILPRSQVNHLAQHAALDGGSKHRPYDDATRFQAVPLTPAAGRRRQPS